MSDAVPSADEASSKNFSARSENIPSLYQLAIAPPIETPNEKTLLIDSPLTLIDTFPLGLDKNVVEHAIRRLKKDLEHAQEELHELEKTLEREISGPSTRTWLLPLMLIGLALSLYGSIVSSSTAEMVATGLMLLWSLAAFWLVYTQDKRLEVSKEANQAEIEIWTKRIEELQHSLAQNQQIIDSGVDGDNFAGNNFPGNNMGEAVERAT